MSEGNAVVFMKALSIQRKDGRKHFTLDVPYLQIDGGDIVVITGKSGSGKTTLMNLLGVVLRPQASSSSSEFSLWEGHRPHNCLRLSWARASRFRRRHVGYITQSGGLLPYLTVKGNVRLSCHLGGTPNSNADKLLEYFGIASHSHKKPSRISGGEYQRAVIARALASEPSLILADEPTASLDPENRGLVLQQLKSHIDSERALVVVTHDLSILLDSRIAKHIHLSANQADGKRHYVSSVVEMVEINHNHKIETELEGARLRLFNMLPPKAQPNPVQLRFLDDESLEILELGTNWSRRGADNSYELELPDRYQRVLAEGKRVYVRVEFQDAGDNFQLWRGSEWQFILPRHFRAQPATSGDWEQNEASQLLNEDESLREDQGMHQQPASVESSAGVTRDRGIPEQEQRYTDLPGSEDKPSNYEVALAITQSHQHPNDPNAVHRVGMIFKQSSPVKRLQQLEEECEKYGQVLPLVEGATVPQPHIHKGFAEDLESLFERNVRREVLAACYELIRPPDIEAGIFHCSVPSLDAYLACIESEGCTWILGIYKN